MDTKQAVIAAKTHLQDVFGSELMSPPRLEEVWLDEADKVWVVTLGFYRTPDALVSRAAGTFSTYDYKSVRIDAANGRPISIRNRDPEMV